MMQLSKEREKEILKVYTRYWDNYLNGNIGDFASMLHDDVQIFGSTGHEVFNGKQTAMQYYEATSDQVKGKVVLQNRKISLLPVDNSIMVTEQADLFILIENSWTFYDHARMSTLFTKVGNEWKVIQQHGSLPDARAEEGEQFNAEQVRKENIQLKEAVKRRTLELEHKNRRSKHPWKGCGPKLWPCAVQRN
jgi:ketosteroid isomerase-like protein